MHGDGLFAPAQLKSIVAEHLSFAMLYGSRDTWAPIPVTAGGDDDTDLVAFSSDNTVALEHAPFLRLYGPP